MSPPDNGQVSFGLVHNALDYLLSAAEHASGNPDARALKYALLHLAAAIELGLKARLYREDWTLIFADPEKADEALLKSGDFKSVDLDTALELVESECLVTISNEHERNIAGLRKLRNKVQHFAIEMDKAALISLLAKNASFLMGFLAEELTTEMEEHHEVRAQILEHLTAFQAFVVERLTSIAPQLQAVPATIWCSNCSQDAVVPVGESPVQCAFCGSQLDAATLAHERSEGEVEECPDCGVEALGLLVYDNDTAGCFCFACGNSGTDFGRCQRCDRMISDQEAALCDDCWSEIMERD